MGQLNIYTNPEFESSIKEYMKRTGIKQKTKAIKQAVAEALEMRKQKGPKANFSDLLGIGLKAPLNPHPKFKSDDDLWK